MCYENMSIEKLEALICKQREINVALYNSIPVPTKEDPLNTAAEPILKEWRKGSADLKKMLKSLHTKKDMNRKGV